MTRRLVLSAVLVVGTTTLAWSQTQQNAPAPAAPDPANFTGTVTPHPTTDIRLLRYSFEAGARTNWHSHAGGQVIVVEQGRMRTQERGKNGREFRPRETYVTEPGVVHWHGALPGEPLTQVALSYGTTMWMEKVTDDQVPREQGRDDDGEVRRIGGVHQSAHGVRCRCTPRRRPDPRSIRSGVRRVMNRPTDERRRERRSSR